MVALVVVVAVDDVVVIVGVAEVVLPPAGMQEFVSAAIFALVIGPTLPTGLMPFALWNASTAFCVTAPK